MMRTEPSEFIKIDARRTQQYEPVSFCQRCQKKLKIQYVNDDGILELRKSTSMADEEREEIYYEKLKILIVDCRINIMQQEAQVPNTIGLEIKDECRKEILEREVQKLENFKDVYHICLMGFKKLGKDQEEKVEEELMSLEVYQEKIFRYVATEFLRQGFSRVSFIEGGFEECHWLCLQHNLQMIFHEQQNSCYHCEERS